jgi:hypothetical protein
MVIPSLGDGTRKGAVVVKAVQRIIDVDVAGDACATLK